MSAAAFGFLGDMVRPLSLGTMEALQRMEITLFDPALAAALSLEDEAAQVGIVHWLHSADMADIQTALWTGAWRQMCAGQMLAMPITPAVLALFRAERDRVLGELDRAAIRVRPRPRQGADKTPGDVIPPSAHTHKVYVLMKHTHQPREEIEWQWPLIDALRMYHCARWDEGCWTVGPRASVDEAEFENFELST